MKVARLLQHVKAFWNIICLLLLLASYIRHFCLLWLFWRNCSICFVNLALLFLYRWFLHFASFHQFFIHILDVKIFFCVFSGSAFDYGQCSCTLIKQAFRAWLLVVRHSYLGWSLFICFSPFFVRSWQIWDVCVSGCVWDHRMLLVLRVGYDVLQKGFIVWSFGIGCLGILRSLVSLRGWFCFLHTTERHHSF